MQKRTQLTKSIALSILLIGGAIAFTSLLEPLIGGNMLFILLAAVVLSALYSDLWVALTAAFVACMSHNFFFQMPRYSLWITDLHDLLELVVFGIVAVVVSVFGSRLRTAMKTAELATQAREEILAVVSHDLKNPLSVIEINGALLGRLPEIHGTGASNCLRLIRESVARMNRLIQDLLDFEKIRSGSLEVSVQPISAKKLLIAVSEAMSPLAALKSITLQTEVEGDDFELECDLQRMLQVFGNLIGNSIKFSAAETRITVLAHRRGQTAGFRVQDQGPGISAQLLPKLFERYSQARETAHLGTGLGLAISRGIIEAHRGRIWAESELRVGTAFSIELPSREPALKNSESA